VIQTNFKNLDGWADCVDGIIRDVKQTIRMHILPGGEMVGLAHFVRENAAAGCMDSIWLVNNHVHLDTYWSVYDSDKNARFRYIPVRWIIEWYYSILMLYIITSGESGSWCNGIPLEINVVVPAAPKCYQLKDMIV